MVKLGLMSLSMDTRVSTVVVPSTTSLSLLSSGTTQVTPPRTIQSPAAADADCTGNATPATSAAASARDVIFFFMALTSRLASKQRIVALHQMLCLARRLGLDSGQLAVRALPFSASQVSELTVSGSGTYSSDT